MEHAFDARGCPGHYGARKDTPACQPWGSFGIASAEARCWGYGQKNVTDT